MGAQDENAEVQERSVLEGVYTDAQADRGEDAFDNNCSYCHSVGQFAGSRWRSTWSGTTLDRFFDLVRTTMPFDGPGRLTDQQYTDILAYVLSENGYPEGQTELAASEEALSGIRVETAPDSAPGAARDARAPPRPAPPRDREDAPWE